MTFTTLTFVLFLPLVFAAYWLAPGRRAQNLVLVGASYAFYGWWDWRFCGLLLLSTVTDWAIGRGLGRVARPAARRLLLVLSLVANLGLLGFFKYFNFFAENLVAALGALGWTLDPFTVRVILPVGISFYTFQSLSYTIDVYRGRLAPTAGLVEFVAFVSFFPQLVAGPIERAEHLLPQMMAPRRFDLELARDGCRQVLWGFVKKMAIADNLALLVQGPYAAPHAASGPALTVATLCFALQIYCDFSAYSDIAIGTARLFGIGLRRNFASPYFSQSVAEFWRRWHISLSTWFRDYVYLPLGGSHGTALRRFGAVMATFVLSGLWHGASWNFLVWGALNGLAVAASAPGAGLRRDALPGGDAPLPSPGAAGRMALTFAFTCAAWVFFRAATLPDALTILRRMAAQALDLSAWAAVADEDLARKGYLAGVVTALLLVEWLGRADAHPLARLRLASTPVRWATYSFALWFALLAAPDKAREFVYFQF